MHAINLLNAIDEGKRKCILVTNNEIGETAEIEMKAAGYKPGDPEWEAIGIAKYTTWPRIKCSVLGNDINGKQLGSEYFTSLTAEKTKKRKTTNKRDSIIKIKKCFFCFFLNFLISRFITFQWR